MLLFCRRRRCTSTAHHLLGHVSEVRAHPDLLIAAVDVLIVASDAVNHVSDRDGLQHHLPAVNLFKLVV